MTWGAVAGGVTSSLLGGVLGGGSGGGASYQQAPMAFRGTSTGLGSTDIRGGRLTTTLDPRLAALQSQLLGQAGGFLGGSQLGEQALGLSGDVLGTVGAFNPQEIAANQFGQMESLLAPIAQKERMGLESRLFSQGRLGSTGGGISQQSLEDSIQRQRSQNLLGALEQGQIAQARQAELARGLGAFGLGAQQAYQGLGLGALQGATGLEQQLAGIGTAGIGAAPGAFMQQQPGIGGIIGGGLLSAGAGMLSQGVSGLFSGGNTGVVGKAGKIF